MNIINIINIIYCIKCFNQNRYKNFKNHSESFLFESIKSDNFNFMNIYNHNYTNIKIKAYSSSKNKTFICVLGVLVNKLGLKIEKELTDWLRNEYIIYKVYQKFPGTLFEYPALKFSQWILENKNISFLLYLHTKGATYKNINLRSKLIKNMWKNEFSKPRNQLYISQLINNKADVVTPLRKGIVTWYNGMFISKRAFQLNNILVYKNRYVYERYFTNKYTRIKGIVSDNCLNTNTFLMLYNNKNKEIHSKNKVFYYKYKIINSIKYKHKLIKLILMFIIILIFKSIKRKYKLFKI